MGLLVRRLKIVRLVGRFKEGADLRSYNLFNKFGNKTEVGYGGDSSFKTSSLHRLDFFSRVVTCASLKAGGKVPDDNDRLMSLVIGERKESMQDLSRRVGIGSNTHDLTGARMISLSTSVSETGENCDKLWRVKVAVTESTEIGKAEEGKEERIRDILSEKYNTKSY